MAPFRNEPHSLVLIGTVHRAPGTEQDLRKLLDLLRPDVITLEMSPWAAAWRLSQAPPLLGRLERFLDRLASGEALVRAELSRHPEVEGIRSFLAFPAEFRIAAAWGRAHDVPLALIDLSEVSARKLRRVERELITLRNLRTLLTLPSREEEPEGYAIARRFLLSDSGKEIRQAFLARRRGPEGIGTRDLWMAEQIRRELKGAPEWRLVHIGGWIHLLEDEEKETLFSRLVDLSPERILAGRTAR